MEPNETDAMLIKPLMVAPFAAVPMLLLLMIALLIPKTKRKKEDI